MLSFQRHPDYSKKREMQVCSNTGTCLTLYFTRKHYSSSVWVREYFNALWLRAVRSRRQVSRQYYFKTDQLIRRELTCNTESSNWIAFTVELTNTSREISWFLARQFACNLFQNCRFSESLETRVSSLETRLSSLETRFLSRETRLSSREKQDETGNLLLSGTVVLTRTIYFWAVPLTHALFREQRTLNATFWIGGVGSFSSTLW